MRWMVNKLMLVLAMALLPAACDQAAAVGPGSDRMATPPADELADQKVINVAVKAAVEANDFDALNRLATEFRQTRARTVSGVWKLAVFHRRVVAELGPRGKGQCDDRSTTFLQQWMARTPDQPAPYIARAAVLEATAWCIRGVGSADSVSPEAFATFAAKVAEARKLLDSHRAIAAVDPQYYAVMARLFIDQGADKAAFRKMLDQATAREPNYHYLYFDAYRYFQPQWYGSDGDIDALARFAMARATGDDGKGVYARYYWFVLDCNCGDIDQSIDWPTMKQSMRAVMARYPSDWNAANFARISCKMNDPQEARSWFARVQGDHSVAWTNIADLMRCQDMAQPLPRSAARCPYAAREGWTREDVDRYCR